MYPNYYKTIYDFFFNVYKNDWKKWKIWRQKNQKKWFCKNKKVFQIDNIDANKILISKEELYGTQNSCKYSIGYNDNDVIRPLCVKLPQMTGYAKKFEFNSTMFFKISDKQLLRRYNQIWKKSWQIIENRT